MKIFAAALMASLVMTIVPAHASFDDHLKAVFHGPGPKVTLPANTGTPDIGAAAIVVDTIAGVPDIDCAVSNCDEVRALLDDIIAAGLADDYASANKVAEDAWNAGGAAIMGLLNSL